MRGTQLLDRAMEVLLAFLPENRPMNIAEITRRVNLSRPTVHRIVAALEERKFLMRHEGDKRFQLGPMLVYIGSVAREGYHVGRWAQPILRRLAEQSGETVHLAVRVGLNEGAFIEKVESKQSVRLHTVVGQPVPLYTGATLKVILANLPEEECERVMAAGLERRARRTITDREELRRHLQEIRNQGYATSSEELFDGAGAVSAPVFGPDGRVIAGLGITVPVFRLTPERKETLIPLVRDAAAELSLKVH